MGTDLDFPSLLHVHLGWGRDRARTIGDLAESLGVSRRVVEKGVESLRASGTPICSGSDGIWLTTSEAELVEQYRALRRRYLRQAVNARHLLRTAKRYAKVQQLGMWDAA